MEDQNNELTNTQNEPQPTTAETQQIATDISDADRASLALLRTHHF